MIALASGANFVARAFAGDPNGTAEIIAQAIRHPGFSFVEILSPCVTFRPEQREWKQLVHPAPVAPTDDPARAARRIMTDDGFNIGVLYAGGRTPYAGGHGQGEARACGPGSGVRAMSAARKTERARRAVASKPRRRCGSATTNKTPATKHVADAKQVRRATGGGRHASRSQRQQSA